MSVSKQSGHDAKSTATSGVASQTVNVITTGDQCGVIFACTYAVSASVFTTATIGGVSAPAVIGGEAADTALEPGNVKAYFLDGISQGASTAFTVNRTNNATVGILYCLAFAAAQACEILTPTIVLLQEDGAYAEQLVDDRDSISNSLRVAAAYYGGATPAPTGSNTNSLGSDDQTQFGTSAGVESVAGQGPRLVGFTQVTADDRAAVHMAVREIPGGKPTLFTPTRMPLGA